MEGFILHYLKGDRPWSCPRHLVPPGLSEMRLVIMVLWDLSTVTQQVTLTPVTPLVLALREAWDVESQLADVHGAIQVPVAAFGGTY